MSIWIVLTEGVESGPVRPQAIGTGRSRSIAAAYFAAPELLLPPELLLSLELPDVPPEGMPLLVSPPVDPPELLVPAAPVSLPEVPPDMPLEESDVPDVPEVPDEPDLPGVAPVGAPDELDGD